MALSEFELIRSCFGRDTGGDAHIIRGIGDDAAILSVPANKHLVISVDTLVEGLHFPKDIAPTDLGFRALATNISDMAAMGAEPAWLTLALTLPASDELWIRSFSQGLFELADRFNMSLIGGDTTRGPLTVTIQIHGLTDPGKAVRRDGAQPGDYIYVSGVIGNGGLAWANLTEGFRIDSPLREKILSRYYRPHSRIDVGRVLRDHANSAIDISDGLSADLSHILEESAVGAVIHPHKLPLVDGEGQIEREVIEQHALGSGDDYELCFTVPEDQRQQLEQRLHDVCPVTCVGRILEQEGLFTEDEQGMRRELEARGFSHF